NLSTLQIQSNSPVCAGNALQLSAPVSSTYTYAWSGPQGFASTQSQPVIQPVALNQAGTYTALVSSPGCGTVTRTLSAVVNSQPAISAGSNSPVCENTALNLSVNTLTGATYMWNGPNGFSSSQSAPVISTTQL